MVKVCDDDAVAHWMIEDGCNDDIQCSASQAETCHQCFNQLGPWHFSAMLWVRAKLICHEDRIKVVSESI